ncbi:histidine kinase/DNA gyrase B/HSP90-like ATPase [Pseudoduganella flava]|uniref:histidine kinase n=2 Tax=Pseudoduganella flava TaxID=871742 RepID=A0A562PLU5_9BURK|nr:HAMP domain-containing sensor histidine kinase [Pseudoduganella flava]TWI45348.1 histidine kinase/DNA gyrase B/HSP90-like ATPase [Pseudoduganella flava]
MMEDQGGSPELFVFLASTVHDMKNSISVLGGTLENLLDQANAQAAVQANLQANAQGQQPPAQPVVNDMSYPQLAHMLYQTRRLSDNLMQLLALYKEVGKPTYPFDPNTVPLSELVHQVASQARVLLVSKQITLEADFPPDLLWTLDEDLVIGVLAHAINNAVRYTRDRIRLVIAERDGMLEFRVEDNGMGFPPSMLEAGAVVGQGVNFLTNSSGLGLFFASEVAKMHKRRQRAGSIRLENGGPLGGGCFVLVLP